MGNSKYSKKQILDCTLRDGGYCNQWRFGENNIRKIITSLSEAGIDIIECGFLSSKKEHSRDITIFNDISEITSFLPSKREHQLFVAMINFGDYCIDDLPNYDGSSIDGIRVAFHKKDMIPALELCKQIIMKGYKVFVQAMVSLSYSDLEFIDLINRVNLFRPYAFYIVDSFGCMKKKDLIRMFYNVENNLSDDIYIGYHSHNNMQLAFSNAQELVELPTNRSLIIDSSVFGMGRGAGNLNTELFVEYLNDNMGNRFILKPLLLIIDEVLNRLYQENYWGYSLPNYLSASHNCHPNYAGYLGEKNTLTIDDIDAIFSMMDDEKKASFDKNYIEAIYFTYMSSNLVSPEKLNEFKGKMNDKRVLVIAPGKSAEKEKNKIIDFVARNNDVIVISVNFDYEYILSDYLFISNLRRYEDLDKSTKRRSIVTSNIDVDDVYLRVNYNELINDEEKVKDNAGLMLISLLIQVGVKEIFLAGMDGYSYNPEDNYIDENMRIMVKKSAYDSLNSGINKALIDFSSKVTIRFFTMPQHLKL